MKKHNKTEKESDTEKRHLVAGGKGDEGNAAAKSLQSCPTVRPHRWQPTRLPHP